MRRTCGRAILAARGRSAVVDVVDVFKQVAKFFQAKKSEHRCLKEDSSLFLAVNDQNMGGFEINIKECGGWGEKSPNSWGN